MSLNWGVTDVLAVTKLAWDLYHNCYLVARGAPDDFRQLVNELASLQGVLRTLRDDINSDKSFLERHGEDRKQTLQRCVANCFETLSKLQKLVVKYRDLHNDESFWKKLKWVPKQGEISDLKAKIMAHTCQLSLCMSSMGNSSLGRIENSLMTAIKRQQDIQEDTQGDEDEIDERTPLTRDRSASTNPISNYSVGGPSLQGIRRNITGTTLADPSMSLPLDSTSSISEGDSDEFGASHTQIPRKEFPSPEARLGSARNHNPDNKVNGGPYASIGQKDKDVVEVVAEAMRELSKIRQKEQLLRPLRTVRQDKNHQPDDSLKEQFQQLADDESRIRRLNARDWLRVATWWLLKAKTNMRAFEKPDLANARGSLSVSVDGRSPANQAYVDLLKSSWILYTIIQREENITSLQTDENRKLFYNLSDGVSSEFSLYKPVDTPEKETLMEQNYNIWELLQPEEESYDDEDLLPGLDNGRWITVEPDDAGEEDEKVLFRTFINAAIGGKKTRINSQGSPYMLLLSMKQGESEPKVTICNQSGSLGLSRDFTIKDLQDCETATRSFGSPRSRGTATETIHFNFGRMSVLVAFTNESDLQEFIRIPRDYFDAVKRREPRQLAKATETLIFKRSVEILEQLEASTSKSMSPQHMFHSCDLRVLETTTKEGWRTTRRLVITSSVGEKKHWCKEFFLPLSRVQIRREGRARDIVVKWSDCSHEQIGTDGNWNQKYTYVYNDNNPNIAFGLSFRNSVDATDFETTVLQLSSAPIFSQPTSSNSHFVYNISDTGPDPKNYKALVIIHTTFEWKYSELFYMYRDTDYQYEHAATRIRFPQVYYTDYFSTHVDKLYKPPPNEGPQFSHCEKLVGNSRVDFDDDTACMRFLSSLTRDHELIFSRRVLFITTKRIRFGSPKSSKGMAQVQLWQKGNSIRLLSRWDDKVEEKWLSMSVPRGGLDHKKDSNRASFPETEYGRGRKIDMANLVARDSREKTQGRKAGPINIAFESVKDREEFAARLDGTSPPIGKNPIDELMAMQDF